jgi:lipopolysaccharide export system permease protein
MKVLFITSNRVGDVVLSTGVLTWIVARYPGAKITVACGPHAADLFRAVPHLERLIVLRKKSLNRHWIELWAKAVGTRWDLIVDLRNSAAARLLRTAWRAHRTRGTGAHKVVENAAVLELEPPPAPHIWLDDEAGQNAARILPAARPLLALGPAANWPPKQWPVENFIALAQKLTAKNGPLSEAPVLVIANVSEHAGVASLLDALGSKGVAVIGYDLLTVAACLKQCALFIGNDSGLMHMAAAVGTPTLGLFGPGYEEIYGPWGSHGAFVRTPEKREELLSRLPSPGAHAPNLMQSLGVESVVEAACGLIGKTCIQGS